jgi:hypothetical protein
MNIPLEYKTPYLHVKQMHDTYEEELQSVLNAPVHHVLKNFFRNKNNVLKEHKKIFDKMPESVAKERIMSNINSFIAHNKRTANYFLNLFPKNNGYQEQERNQ